MEVSDLHRAAGRGAGVRVIPVRGRDIGALVLQAGEEAIDDAHGHPGQKGFDHRQHGCEVRGAPLFVALFSQSSTSMPAALTFTAHS